MQTMTTSQKLLFSMSSRIISRNREFKGRHKGETCYIVGNGASLKYMDLNAFSNHVSIGLNLICVHKDLKALDMPYLVLPQPFYFYPWVVRRNRKLQRNSMGKFIGNVITGIPNVSLFTTLSNYFGPKIPNTYFLHHFGHKQPDSSVCEIDGCFSFIKGALDVGIGLAINMGFEKAYLLGCDYLSSPFKSRHFYDYGHPVINANGIHPYDLLLREASNSIELRLITDRGGSDWLPSDEYQSFTGRMLNYRENTEIVSAQYLQEMEKAYQKKLVNRSVYPIRPTD